MINNLHPWNTFKKPVLIVGLNQQSGIKRNEYYYTQFLGEFIKKLPCLFSGTALLLLSGRNEYTQLYNLLIVP